MSIIFASQLLEQMLQTNYSYIQYLLHYDANKRIVTLFEIIDDFILFNFFNVQA